MSEYAERDIRALDKAGNYYTKHVLAMTSEGLHSKAEIAAELAWRDSRISALEAIIQEQIREYDEGGLFEAAASRLLAWLPRD